MSVDQLELKALGGKAKEHCAICKRQHYEREFWRDWLHSSNMFSCLTPLARFERKKGAYFKLESDCNNNKEWSSMNLSFIHKEIFFLQIATWKPHYLYNHKIEFQTEFPNLLSSPAEIVIRRQNKLNLDFLKKKRQFPLPEPKKKSSANVSCTDKNVFFINNLFQ